MAPTRQLAAIMFTDIVGFTSLMGESEQKALALLKKNKELHQTLTIQYNGQLLKEIGDGILASFNSVSEAVYCAGALQKAAKEQEINLKIGIHEGEVVFQDNDVFGDGVNIASRIEALAATGEILLSESAYKNIKNKEGIEAYFVKEETLKNVDEPVRIYRVSVKISETDIYNYQNDDKVAEEQIEKSIAVLPFTNMSADKEQDYFCYGITEDILNDLTQLEGIHVVARTSSFGFKDKDQDIREIGRKLGVQTIVEGSVRKTGNRLRITAQLINVADGFRLWSKRYDRDLEDVFAIQNEIAKNIVQALEISLSEREKRVLEKVMTQNVQAYDFYIKGREYYHTSHRSTIKYAIDLFSRAIQIDEYYALAYAGLADSYSRFHMYYDRSSENLKQALVASEKARELDPELAEAHSSRGVALAQNKQYKEAEKEFETAIQLNPKLFIAYYDYARAWRTQGKHEQAARLFEKATQVEPENYDAALFLVSAYEDLNLETEMKKANHRALEVVRKHLDMNPDDTRALYLGAGALIKADESEEALQWVEKALTIDPNETAVLYNATCIYSTLGEVEVALDYFEKAIDSGYASQEWIDNDSDLDQIRDHPRFQKILEKLN